MELRKAGCNAALIAPDTLGNGDSAPPGIDRPDIAYFADSMRRMIDVLKALDTYADPYIAAFEYRAYERMPNVEAPVLLLKADSELPVLQAAVAKAASLLRDAHIATVTGGDTAKAKAIAGFLAPEQ